MLFRAQSIRRIQDAHLTVLASCGSCFSLASYKGNCQSTFYFFLPTSSSTMSSQLGQPGPSSTVSSPLPFFFVTTFIAFDLIGRLRYKNSIFFFLNGFVNFGVSTKLPCTWNSRWQCCTAYLSCRRWPRCWLRLASPSSIL